jgi:regulator of protease activity HflC (stomatin/prohibitin superfamily)
MDSALAWIGQLANWFGQFVPRWIILNTTEGAVKFVGGSRAVLLGPGIHWFWPARTEIKSWVVARQSINLATLTVTTRDGKVIAVGGLLIFRISDAMKLIAETWNPDQTIRDIAASVVHEVCSRSTWDELQQAKNNGALGRDLRRMMRKRLDTFGVQVIGATLTDFAPCRVLKVLQSVSNDQG